MIRRLPRFGTLDQFDFHDTLATADATNIVFFTKPGCASCGHWRRLLQRYATCHLDTRVFEVDVSRDQALAQEFGLFHLPSLHLFRNGDYFGELQCEAKEEVLTSTIQAALIQPAREMP